MFLSAALIINVGREFQYVKLGGSKFALNGDLEFNKWLF